MSARKRVSQRHVHERLMQGLTNKADGTWTTLSAEKAEPGYVVRGTRNRERNVRNRARKRTRTKTAWNKAEARAKQALAREGDTSPPLPSFVTKFLD